MGSFECDYFCFLEIERRTRCCEEPFVTNDSPSVLGATDGESFSDSAKR